MVGIVSYGGYIPTLRMERSVIAKAWGRGALKGERSVANNDEDSVTMAVEAVVNCLKEKDRQAVDGLLFASTTPVYREKMNAALIGTAVDLNREIATVDYANSLRSGATALSAAIDTVAADSAQQILVTAADTRRGYPKSDQEQLFGDGAGALLIGKNDLVATYEGRFSISNEMMDVWRNSEDKYVKQWEARFVTGQGYTAHIKEVVNGLLNKYKLSTKDIAKVIIPAPDPRSHFSLSKLLGFDGETQMQDPLLSKVGHCGTAQPFLMLAAALETAMPGQLILMATYGDGADAMLFKTTDQVKKQVNLRTVKTLLNEKLIFTSYARFLSYKEIIEAQPGEPFRLLPSATVSWRERSSSLRCHASRCKKCGLITYPIQRICYNCSSKDEFEEIRISDLEGKVFTFTKDNIAGRSDDPVVIQTVVEMAGGVRFYGLMTDFDASQIDIDMPVRLTFRRFYEGAGFQNYFWKLKPILNGGDN